MSKLLEALKASVRENKETTAKSEYESVQEQLASVYLAGDKSRKPEYPMIIKVIEKRGLPGAIPWIITSLAFLLTAFSLFSTKRIFVDVQVIDENSPYIAALRHGTLLPEPEPWAQSNDEVSKDGVNGSLQLKSAVFEGASKLKSSSEPNLLTLVNTSVAPFARAAMTLPEPTNLSGYKIVFDAKGAKGGENIAFALKDRGNVLAFAKGKVFPFPGALTTDWQRAEIRLDEAVEAFNEKSVVAMRFEFGSNVQNHPGDTIYVKNVRIIPL
jgi:hypothetical protein